jgi:hypothetical protein
VIKVALPAHLRKLADVTGEVELDLGLHGGPDAPVTQQRILDALETRFPALRGTIRDHATRKRRPFVRFFACEQDLSHEPPDAPVPEPVAAGREPFVVIGAMAGG